MLKDPSALKQKALALVQVTSKWLWVAGVQVSMQGVSGGWVVTADSGSCQYRNLVYQAGHLLGHGFNMLGRLGGVVCQGTDELSLCWVHTGWSILLGFVVCGTQNHQAAGQGGTKKQPFIG